MSFSSLLSKISTDKNLKEKVKNVSTSLTSSNKSVNSNSQNQSQSKTSSSKPISNRLSLSTSQRQRPNSISNVSYIDDDPAVRRLKEARRKERERLDALKGKPTTKTKTSRQTSSGPKRSTSLTPSSRSSSVGISRSLPPPSKSSSLPPPTKSRFKFKPSKHNISLPTNKPSTNEANKLSFQELMEQASTIAKPSTSAIPFTSPVKSKPKGPSRALQSIHKARTRELQTLTSNTSPEMKSRKDFAQQNPISKQELSRPLRKPEFAKPNPDLLKKLSKKKQYQSSQPLSAKFNSKGYSSSINRSTKSDSYDIDAQDEDEDEYDQYGYEDDYEDDGFIVDEEDEEDAFYAREKAKEKRAYDNMKSQGYSKDEIWEIFNRGKKRSYYDQYDDDSDDMEATGNEILEDEERTLKQARLDDLREQKLLEQKALQKGKLFKK